MVNAISDAAGVCAPGLAGQQKQQAQIVQQQHGQSPVQPQYRGRTMSNKAKIKQLEKALAEKARQVQQLEQEHQRLRLREAVLLQMVREQGDEVYHMGHLFSSLAVDQLQGGSAAADASAVTLSSCTNSSASSGTNGSTVTTQSIQSPALITALLKDFEAFELMQHIRPSPVSAVHNPQQQQQEQQSRTGRELTAITPEDVSQMQHASVETLAKKLLQLTQKLGFVLYVHKQQMPAAQLGDACSLEQAVHEYDRFCALMHTGAPKQVLKLCSINLQTLEECAPPPASFWASVAEQLELTDDQQAALTTGFQVYLDQATPIVHRIHALMKQLQEGLDAAHGVELGSGAGADLACGNEVVNNVETSHSADGPKSAGYMSSRGCMSREANNAPECYTSVASGSPMAGAAAAPASPAAAAPAPAASPAAAAPAALPVADGVVSKQNTAPVPAAAEEPVALIASYPWDLQRLVTAAATKPAASAANLTAITAAALPLVAAEDAAKMEHLISQLCSMLQRVREMRRRLIYMWVNTMTVQQTAVAAVASLPYWVQPVPICEQVWQHSQKQHEQQQQQH